MLLALALTCLPAVQATHCTETPLPAPGGGLAFGIVDSSSSIQLVGDFAVLPGAGAGGPLLTYTRSGPEAAWEYRSALSPEGLSAGSTFADNVDLDVPAGGPPTLVVSDSRWENAAGVPRGRVLTFEWEEASGSWLLLDQLLAPVGGPLRFGQGIARDGEWLVVTNQTPSATLGQPLFLYRRGNGSNSWVADSMIADPGDGWEDHLLALRGDVLVAYAREFAQADDDLQAFVLDPVQGWIPDAIATSPQAVAGMRRLRLVEGEILYSVLDQPDTIRALRRDAAGTWALAQILDGSAFPGQPTLFIDFEASDVRLVVGDPLFGGTVQTGFPGRVLTYVRDPLSGDWRGDLALQREMPLVNGELFGREVAVDGHRVLIANNPFGVVQSVFDFNLQPDDCDGDGTPDICQMIEPSNDRNGDGVLDVCQQVGTVYCEPANPNSTGNAGRLGGLGSAALSAASLDLCSDRLPANEFGYLLASSAPGFVPNVAGSSGNLCLAGGPDFGRFTGQVLSSGPAGIACVAIDLPTVPTAVGPKVLVPGDTWYFQFWYRDGQTSNHTPGVRIEFQ